MNQTLLFAEVDQSAVVSPCGAYRYRLGRRWGDGPAMLWVMLNPSTADASVDDPTIRRCIGYARRWDFGSMAVGNLFAFRATDPADMRRAADPVGPENDRHLLEMAAEASLVVAAWGNHGSFLGRSSLVGLMIPGMRVLGLTKAGEPAHPLYLCGDLVAVDWTIPAGRQGQ